jgi:hypothetical protein
MKSWKLVVSNKIYYSFWLYTSGLMLEFVLIMAVHCVVVYQKYLQGWNMNTAGYISHYIYIVYTSSHTYSYSTYAFSLLRGIMVFLPSV